ncbi:MAG: leukotoxin LktA family filamentous adhesin, partial [Halanaerobiales bacterium]
MIKRVFILLLILSVLSQYTFGIYALAAGPQIVVDGKTATELEQEGNITDISTSTVSMDSAFNSFTRFNVNRDNIVNLYLPGNTSNLLNMVHSETSHINGILNSIKDNQIGGNVYFLNPHGIMVGSQGAVNVGSLTAVTPTTGFMDSVFTSAGDISASAVDKIKEGSIPVSDSGLINVAGEVNARDDINLAAGEITVAGGEDGRGAVSTGANFSETSTANRDRVNFSDVVNINGVESGERVAVENGDIKIKAAGDFVNKGILAADGADNLAAGSIDVRAGNDIYLNQGSLVSARGYGEDSDGGDIIIFADRDAEFNSGAGIDAGGGNSGDGGFIEFSAKEDVRLAGGQFMAAAEEGEAGSILIDPQNVLIASDLNRSGSSSGDFDGEDIQYFHGADFKMEASESITVNEDVIISTRAISGSDHLNNDSSGDSGNLAMTAPQITLNTGSKLLAHAIDSDSDGNEYEAGNITLTADMPDTYIQQDYDSPSSAGIDIQGATLKGKNITMNAKATGDYSWNAEDYEDWIEDEQNSEALADLNQKEYNDLEIIDDDLKLTDENNFNVGYAEAAGDSHILLDGDSVIEAEETVDMSAETTATARIRTGDIAVGISFAYGDLDSRAELEIGDGVQITSGELNLTSLNNAVLDINAIAYNKTGDYEAGIAVGNAEVTCLTEIADGAEISTDNLAISAVNNNSFSTKATSMVGDGGTAGISAAIFNADTNATAGYSGDQPQGSFQNLTIEALDNNNQNITTASAAVGTSELMKPLLSGGKKAVGFVKGKLGSDSTSGFDQRSGVGDQESGNKLELAGAVSYADTGQTAEAFIGDDTVLDVDGDIALSARVRDANLQNRAKSNATAEADDGSGSTTSLSAAFAYGDYDHTARTHTGDRSILTADHLGLRSDVLKPYEKDWTKLDTVGDITDKIGALMGLTSEGYLTGHAQASGSGSSAEDVTIAGSAAYLDFNNSSQAYTGRGSEIYLREDDDGWTTTLPGADELSGLPDGFSQLTWETPLQVTANTEINGVYVSGNLNLILSGEEGTSIGGAYNQVNYTNETRAYISEGTVVEGQEIETDENSEDDETEPSYYNPGITVRAEDQENIITIGPSAGNGSSWGFNGVFSLGKVNNITEASIDDEAWINAGEVGIQASDEVINWSLSGAVNLSENAGV